MTNPDANYQITAFPAQIGQQNLLSPSDRRFLLAMLLLYIDAAFRLDGKVDKAMLDKAISLIDPDPPQEAENG